MTRAAEDASAVARVLAGEPAAFEEIVRRWQRPILNLAWRYFHDRGRAEDVAQDVFLKVYRNLHRFRRDSAFSTWLFAVAVNVCRSRFRDAPPVPIPLDAVEGHPALRQLPEPDSRHEDAVRRAVATLPEKYRDAVILYYFHDMDVAEAAGTLGIPIGTLKAHLHRGRALLRRKLGAVPESGPVAEEA